MKKALILALSLASAITAAAVPADTPTGQERWEAAIDTVETDGYYNIRLNPELIGLSGGNGFEDVRILDGDGAEVPYMVRESAPEQHVSRMEMYPLLKNTGSDSTNVLVVDNAVRERIGRFYVVMRAAEVDKYVSVRGSDDLGQWYVVRQRTTLNIERGTDGNEVAVLDIPEGDYRYYEITIINSQGSPLSVVGVGKVGSRSIYGQYLPVETDDIAVSEDSLRQTVIAFPALHAPYLIDRLEIVVVANKSLYHRNAELITGRHARYLTLSSKGSNIFQLDGFPMDSTTRIVIGNGNNPPLAIAEVRTWTLARYLCARLEAGKRYTLMTGVEGCGNYDLEYFRDELNEELPVVGIGLPVRENIVAAHVPGPRFFERPWFLWAVMGLVGAILVGACLQALRAARKR